MGEITVRNLEKLKRICLIMGLAMVLFFTLTGCESRADEEDESDGTNFFNEMKSSEDINGEDKEETETSDQVDETEESDEAAEAKEVDETSDSEPADAAQTESEKKDTKTKKSVEEITFLVTASSTLVENLSTETKNHSPINMTDNDANTAWVEGAVGDGVGEWILLEGDSIFDLDTIQITNGYTGTDSLYEKNNRIKKLEITADNGQSKVVDLVDGLKEAQNFILNFKDIQSIKIVILEVYEGSKYEDLCISELLFNKKQIKITAGTASNKVESIEVMESDIIDGIMDIEVQAYDNNNVLIWERSFPDIIMTELEPYSKPLISDNGILIEVYGNLYYMNPANGKNIWVYDGLGGGASIINGFDHNFLVTSVYLNLLNCISETGQLVWKIEPTDEVYNAYNVEIKSGLIYVYFDSTRNNDYLVFDKDGNYIKASSKDIVFK